MEMGRGNKKTDSISVDTSVIAEQKWLNPMWFVLAFALSFLPFLWEKHFFVLYLINGTCIVLMWLIYRFAYRNKAERVNGNAALTEALSAVRKKNWGRIFLAITYFMTAVNLIVSLISLNPVLLLIISLVISISVVAFTFATEMKTRKAQEELCKSCGKESFIDDDDKWLWGIFYCNPEDDKLVINSRVGTNSTFNLAKPAGKLIGVISLIILLSVPFIMPITNAVGNKAPEFTLSETELRARSGGTEYDINLFEIDSIELLDELPSLIKVSGTNFEDLLKGQFSAKDIGSISACLDPTSPPYLLISSNDGNNYLLGSREEGEIQSIYEKIK